MGSLTSVVPGGELTRVFVPLIPLPYNEFSSSMFSFGPQQKAREIRTIVLLVLLAVAVCALLNAGNFGTIDTVRRWQSGAVDPPG